MSFLHGHARLSANHRAALKSTISRVNQSQGSSQVDHFARQPITGQLSSRPFPRQPITGQLSSRPLRPSTNHSSACKSTIACVDQCQHGLKISPFSHIFVCLWVRPLIDMINILRLLVNGALILVELINILR